MAINQRFYALILENYHSTVVCSNVLLVLSTSRTINFCLVSAWNNCLKIMKTTSLEVDRL